MFRIFVFSRPERQFIEPQPADVKNRQNYRGLGRYQPWTRSEELHEEAYSKWADGWNERMWGHLYSSSCMFTKHKYYQWFDKHIEWDNVGHLGTLLKYVRQYAETAPLCEKALCFPHKHLEKVREIHEAFGGKSIFVLLNLILQRINLEVSEGKSFRILE